MMEYRFSFRTGRLQAPGVPGILKLQGGSGRVVSLAGELPAENMFPPEALREAVNRALGADGGSLRHGWPEGCLPLREQLCERMTAKGMPVEPDQMLLTTGSRQAIDLAVRVLTDPGDTVLVDNPTHPACLQLFGLNGLQVAAAGSDADGIRLEDAERLMKETKPRLVYAMPTFGNPTGRVWSPERRRGLLELCREHGIPIIEDDPYGDLKFDADAVYPTICSLDGRTDGGHVLYIGTFSKTAAPLLQTGWVIGDRTVIRNMAKAQQAAGPHAGPLDWHAFAQLLRHYPLDAHIRAVAAEYGARMRRMQKLLVQRMPEGVAWAEPKGGMLIWLELPDGLDAEALLRAAVPKGVTFVPGASFYAGTPKRNTARLSLAGVPDERMAAGVERLAEAIGEFTARSM